MKEKGIKKIPGCSLMELNGMIYAFFAEGSAHPDSEKIYEKIEEIVTRIKKAGYVPNVAEARLDAEEEEKGLFLITVRSWPLHLVSSKLPLELLLGCRKISEHAQIVTWQPS